MMEVIDGYSQLSFKKADFQISKSDRSMITFSETLDKEGERRFRNF
jgi:hypothetical protein